MVGDVHGQADLLAQILDAIAHTTKEAPVRHLVFLGDLIDRGPESVRSVDLAMQGSELAQADELHILPGNHDLRLLDVLDNEDQLHIWLRNGGKTVLDETGQTGADVMWGDISKTLSDVFDARYLEIMRSGPTHLRLGDLLLVHAGLHPHQKIHDFLSIDRRRINSDEHWATIRYPFLNWEGGWDQGDPDPSRREQRPTVVVSGHTPALREDLIAADQLQVCDGIDVFRAIALDIGASFRPQLAWGHFRMGNHGAEVQIHAVVGCEAAVGGN